MEVKESPCLSACFLKRKQLNAVTVLASKKLYAGTVANFQNFKSIVFDPTTLLPILVRFIISPVTYNCATATKLANMVKQLI